MRARSTPRPRPLARRLILPAAPAGTPPACAPARSSAPARAPPDPGVRRRRVLRAYGLLWTLQDHEKAAWGVPARPSVDRDLDLARRGPGPGPRQLRVLRPAGHPHQGAIAHERQHRR